MYIVIYTYVVRSRSPSTQVQHQEHTQFWVPSCWAWSNSADSKIIVESSSVNEINEEPMVLRSPIFEILNCQENWKKPADFGHEKSRDVPFCTERNSFETIRENYIYIMICYSHSHTRLLDSKIYNSRYNNLIVYTAANFGIVDPLVAKRYQCSIGKSSFLWLNQTDHGFNSYVR